MAPRVKMMPKPAKSSRTPVSTNRLIPPRAGGLYAMMKVSSSVPEDLAPIGRLAAQHLAKRSHDGHQHAQATVHEAHGQRHGRLAAAGADQRAGVANQPPAIDILEDHYRPQRLIDDWKRREQRVEIGVLVDVDDEQAFVEDS